MKKWFCFCAVVFFVFCVHADELTAGSANKKIAVRYLQLAKNYVSQNDWRSVEKSCENGLRYDDSIADLHYLKALSFFHQEKPRCEILPVIQNAFGKTEWMDYGSPNARIFYADLLCQTGKPKEAISVLDSSPFVYSADAEYVRIKSLFEINTADSVARAEEKISSALRVYPNDVRFFYLFFNYEYNLRSAQKTISPLVKRIAGNFILNLPHYDKKQTDLEILASFFAEGETQKRLLKAFDARGLSHVLYPLAALEAGVLSQKDALDYFVEFLGEKIDAGVLFRFYSMITDEDCKKIFDGYLNAFDGTLLYDTNNTLEENLVVKYERGRAKTVSFDFDNDGQFEWEAACDFGSPKSAFVNSSLFKKANTVLKNVHIMYGTYPNVAAAAFELDIPHEHNSAVMSFPAESFANGLFEIVRSPEIDSTDFFVIDETSLVYESESFDIASFFAAANGITQPSFERNGAVVKFSLLNGDLTRADYFADGKKYAEAVFADLAQFKVARLADKDGDGIFETTEYYTDDENWKTAAENGADTALMNIFGSSFFDGGTAFYLNAIGIDRNLDDKHDFFETYFPQNGKMLQLDSDFDGAYDVVHMTFPKEPGKPAVESDSFFIRDVVKGEFWVTVVFNDGEASFITEVKDEKELPGLLESEENRISVFRGTGGNGHFFWLGQKENPAYEAEITERAPLYANGQVFQIEKGGCYIRGIKIGEDIFAQRIEKFVPAENAGDGEDSLSGENVGK